MSDGEEVSLDVILRKSGQRQRGLLGLSAPGNSYDAKKPRDATKRPKSAKAAAEASPSARIRMARLSAATPLLTELDTEAREVGKVGMPVGRGGSQTEAATRALVVRVAAVLEQLGVMTLCAFHRRARQPLLEVLRRAPIRRMPCTLRRQRRLRIRMRRRTAMITTLRRRRRTRRTRRRTGGEGGGGSRWDGRAVAEAG